MRNEDTHTPAVIDDTYPCDTLGANCTDIHSAKIHLEDYGFINFAQIETRYVRSMFVIA